MLVRDIYRLHQCCGVNASKANSTLNTNRQLYGYVPTDNLSGTTAYASPDGKNVCTITDSVNLRSVCKRLLCCANYFVS